MAMQREIDRKCQEPDCDSAAVVEVLTEKLDLVGRYCRRGGNRIVKEQMEKERESVAEPADIREAV